MNFFWNIFSGFSIPYNAMPVYLAWINRIAPTSWVIYGLVVAQLGGDNDAIVDSFGLLLPVPQFLETAFGYQFHFRWYCILIVGGFALAFMLLSAFALLKINYNIR